MVGRVELLVYGDIPGYTSKRSIRKLGGNPDTWMKPRKLSDLDLRISALNREMCPLKYLKTKGKTEQLILEQYKE